MEGKWSFPLPQVFGGRSLPCCQTVHCSYSPDQERTFLPIAERKKSPVVRVLVWDSIPYSATDSLYNAGQVTWSVATVPHLYNGDSGNALPHWDIGKISASETVRCSDIMAMDDIKYLKQGCHLSPALRLTHVLCKATH